MSKWLGVALDDVKLDPPIDLDVTEWLIKMNDKQSADFNEIADFIDTMFGLDE